MEQPKVSVIMGTFNGERTLAQSIDSIISQDFKNWEFIICDDCSTDKTNQILQEYAQKDSRIKVIRNSKNSKLAHSLNRCLELCQGQYVARMDDDDESLPNRFSKQVEFLEKHPEYAVVGTNVFITDGKNIYSENIVKEILDRMDIISGKTFIHPTIMMRKDVYRQLGGYNISRRTQRCEDLDLWYRFYANNFKGYNIQKSLYIYREDINALKKRTLKSAFFTALTIFNGFRLLKAPFYKYILVIKPIIATLIPKFILMKRHNLHRNISKK